MFDDAGYAATLEALIAQAQRAVPRRRGAVGGRLLRRQGLHRGAAAGLAGPGRAAPKGSARKPVHVISTDTLVENPVVAAWVTHSLEVMGAAATAQGLPIKPHRLTPAVTDSFWVNLIGRGYPAPRPKFRWCTERLKIKPSNTFIRDVVRAHGEAILVLGTRKAESSGRVAPDDGPGGPAGPGPAQPERLSAQLPRLHADRELVQRRRVDLPDADRQPVGLLQQGAADACTRAPRRTASARWSSTPRTPSCGDSRFGCWVCTLVDKDKSMSAMIQNDEEKEWMLPLLELRNELDVADDRHLRDFRRMNGSVQLFHDRPIPGPYTQEARERWLRELLEAQAWIRGNGPAHVRSLELITLAELEEIRRIWVVDKHEFEDRLPAIYADATGEPYPGGPLDEHLPLGAETVDVLREITGEDRLHFELVRELLDIEQRHRAQARRAGLFESLEKALRRGFYDDEADATARAQQRRDAWRVDPRRRRR